MKHLIIITAIALLTCVTGIAADKSPQRHKPHRQFRKPVALTMPDALKAGDKIAIISPARRQESRESCCYTASLGL